MDFEIPYQKTVGRQCCRQGKQASHKVKQVRSKNCRLLLSSLCEFHRNHHCHHFWSLVCICVFLSTFTHINSLDTHANLMRKVQLFSFNTHTNSMRKVQLSFAFCRRWNWDMRRDLLTSSCLNFICCKKIWTVKVRSRSLSSKMTTVCTMKFCKLQIPFPSGPPSPDTRLDVHI